MPSTSSVVKVHFRLNTAAYMKIHFLRTPLICCYCPTCFLGNLQRNRPSIVLKTEALTRPLALILNINEIWNW